MEHILIRIASPDDAGAIREIYRHYAENTAVTFDYDTPPEEEFRRRIADTLRSYPYLAAEEDGVVLGYACAGRFHPRPAYGWCAEVTVYLRPDCRRRGLGRRLYRALEDALGAMGVVNLYACIASPGGEDEYLTRDSERFHERMGYTLAGRFRRCGFKFGRWYDMVWMEKLIGEHRSDQPPVESFPAAAGRMPFGFLQEPWK